jgi:hypothetical protein
MEDQKKLGQNLGDVWHHIEGDVKAQQGIRFNIFQLNQTYLGKDSRLNIGPKDLPVKGPLIGILKPIVFLLYGYKRSTSCSKFIDVPLQPVG